jgi:D-alanyl-lipoteichoic acid acyltransferase DltB (MBOAT superfamily)
MITMVLGGLWHGAGWTFIIWGALHGAGQVVGYLRRRRRVAQGLPPVATGPVRVWWQRFATFQFVCLAWIFFAASSLSNALAMLNRLFTGWGEPSPLITPLLVITVGLVLAAQYVPRGFMERMQALFSEQVAVVQACVLAGALLTVTTLGPTGVAPFIYYRF